MARGERGQRRTAKNMQLFVNVKIDVKKYKKFVIKLIFGGKAFQKGLMTRARILPYVEVLGGTGIGILAMTS